MDDPWKHAKLNKIDTKGQIFHLYDPTYKKYLKKTNLERQKRY